MSSATPPPGHPSPPPLAELAARIRAIERRPARLPATRAEPQAPGAETEPAWTFGAAQIDDLLAPGGLETGALHEIKPVGPATHWSAARAFACALAARRLLSIHATPVASAPILCCATARLTSEHGLLYGPGLATFGLDPRRLILAETLKAADVLWAMEEGLKSESLAAVVGLIDAVELTPARRLALAAARSATPCLLLTHPSAAATAATATRWRVGTGGERPAPLRNRGIGRAPHVDCPRALPLSPSAGRSSSH